MDLEPSWETVIDYVITTREGMKKIKEMRSGRRVDSNHMSLQVKLREITQEDILQK